MGVFLGVAKISNIFLGCLKFLIFFTRPRGDRGKMIHFFKIFFSCFYDWIYLIAFNCIIHCVPPVINLCKYVTGSLKAYYYIICS